MNVITRIIIFISLSTCLLAQGGSNYSIFGIGDLHTVIGSFYDGNGGTNIAIPNSHAINPMNPAQWTLINTTRIQAGYRFNQQIVSSKTTEILQNNGKVDGMMMNFSIDTNRGISFGLGISAYSSVNYLISVPVKINAGDLTLDAKSIYQGLGGLSQAYMGLAGRLFDRISLGASLFTVFGNIQNTVTTVAYNSNSYSSVSDIRDNYQTLGFRAGIAIDLFDGFRAGAVFENHGKFKVNRNYLYYSATTSDTSYNSKFDINMPMGLGFGLSYQTGKFIFGADYLFRDFSELNYNKPESAKFRKFNQLSFGISRIGNNSAYTPFLDKMSYSIGFGYKEQYYSINGNDINELYGSLGVQLPIVGFAFLDAALTVGKRGTIENGLLKEIFTRLNVTISLGDIWFKPFVRDY